MVRFFQHELLFDRLPLTRWRNLAIDTRIEFDTAKLSNVLFVKLFTPLSAVLNIRGQT